MHSCEDVATCVYTHVTICELCLSVRTYASPILHASILRVYIHRPLVLTVHLVNLFHFARTSIGVHTVFAQFVCALPPPPPILPWCQDLAPEQLEEHPIIFGDYIKVGASKDDRLYEEYPDMKKLRNALSEVGKVYKGAHVLRKSVGRKHTRTI